MNTVQNRVEGPGGEVMVLVAETPEDERRLRHTQHVLRLAAHPGVVALAAPAGDALQGGPEGPLTLRLARLAGPCLADVDDEDSTAVVRWAAALAMTVADLHDIGCFHGAIRPEHVVFDGEGRPVLCGFGSAVAVADPAEAGPLARSDNAALAHLVRDRLGSGADRGLARRLHLASTGSRRAPDARRIAHLLAEQAESARAADHVEAADQVEAAGALGAPSSVRLVTGSWDGAPSARRVVPAVVVSAATVAGAALVWHTVASSHPGRAARRPAPAEAATCRPTGCPGSPAVPDGSAVLDGPAGPAVLHTAAGVRPVTAVGRWDCGPPRPAVLDLRSGAVWVLPGWPAPGHPVTGRFVATVPGATGLAARPGGPDCDGLVADRPGGSALVSAGGPP